MALSAFDDPARPPMALSAFDDPARPPSEADLEAVLGSAATARWRSIVGGATYAEGRGVRFPVEADADLEVALELARIKLGR